MVSSHGEMMHPGYFLNAYVKSDKYHRSGVKD